MPSSSLYSQSATINLTGTRDIIDFYHGIKVNGVATAPDHIEVDIGANSTSAGTGAGSSSATLTPGGANIAAGGTVTVGGASFSEVYTARVTPTLPFEFAIGANTAATLANLVAAFNRDTQQSFTASVQAGPTVRFIATTGPASGVTDTRVADVSASATTWAGGAVATAASTRTVAGNPSWTCVYRGTDYVRIKFRGMETTDSFPVVIRCMRLHSWSRPVATAKSSGTDGMVNLALSQVTFNSATGNFLVNGVVPGEDTLVIADHDDPANNGIYQIAAVTATTLTVASTKVFKKTITGGNDMDWAINAKAIDLNMEPTVVQVPFDLPSSDTHAVGAPATDVELPGQAIETAELADGILSADAAGRAKMAASFFGAAVPASVAHFADLFMPDAKLSGDRGKTSGYSISGENPSTDISGAGANAGISVSLDGTPAAHLFVADPSAYPLGGGAPVALNTGARIAQALTEVATAVGSPTVVSYNDGGSGRYTIIGTSRGSTSTVTVTAGMINDITGLLKLRTANGAVEMTGANSLDRYNLEQNAVAIQRFRDVGMRSIGHVDFAAGTNVGDTITLGGTEVWTARAVIALPYEYDQSGGTGATCAASFAAQVNATAGSGYLALVMGTGADIVALFPKSTIANNPAMAESTAGARTVVSGANMTNRRLAAERRMAWGQYTMTAADVTTLAPGGLAGEIPIGCIDSTTQPTLLSVRYATAAGDDIVMGANFPGVRVAQVGALQWLVILSEAGVAASLANTDTVSYILAY